MTDYNRIREIAKKEGRFVVFYITIVGAFPVLSQQ